jgi:hypothetical protein
MDRVAELVKKTRDETLVEKTKDGKLANATTSMPIETTTLEGSAPAKVILDDLASVDLNVAACAQGYKRPQGAGYALDVTITANGATHFQ